MKEAIKLAIEMGGYNSLSIRDCELDPVLDRVNITTFDGDKDWLDNVDVETDPLFWQALSRALGWHECDTHWEWKSKALEYFELVLTGGDIKKFWKELTSSHKGN